jgi:pimeloyl-ACP methyl ester carboxylesterase
MIVTQTDPGLSLEVPDGRLYYELRGRGPLVVLAGAPMDARAFAPLADLLSRDHTVLTTDPRGINRSVLHDPDTDSTPELRADDLARLITYVDAGPAVALGSSGGAISVLALAEAQPELVTTVIAHEPPLSELLPDREELRRRTEDVAVTHLAGDVRGAWVKFLQLANIDLPPFVLEQMIGGHRSAQDVADDRYQHAHMLIPGTRWQPDLERLADVSTRIFVGIGEDSGGQLCERTSEALAVGLGIAPTRFPGGHIGFVDDPAAFEVRLREVMADCPRRTE